MPYEMPWRCADKRPHAPHVMGDDACAGYAEPGPDYEEPSTRTYCRPASSDPREHSWSALGSGYACACGRMVR